jgi:4-hydroxy-tetrahydrodipicolinate synthase
VETPITRHPLAGVYAAAITPINQDLSIALDDIPDYLAFLAERGCHGALLLGTTGEGPSFSVNERLEIFNSAIRVREVHPEFRLFAGTGTPNLEETIQLTIKAFDLGFDAAVVLPPYYYYRATDEGLLLWFQELIQRAVPEDKTILGYHFPDQTNVPIPLPLISQLRDSYPNQFSGFKDSTKSAQYSFQVGKSLDENTLALVGNDEIFVESLFAGSSGCITAMANLFSPTLRKIWDSYHEGKRAEEDQAFLTKKKKILDSYRPFPPTIKAVLHHDHNFPRWSVYPPLSQLEKPILHQMLEDLNSKHPE